MQEKKKEVTTNQERIADTLCIIGTGIALSGIGVITSGGVIENPRLMAGGAATMTVGLFFYGAGLLIHKILPPSR